MTALRTAALTEIYLAEMKDHKEVDEKVAMKAKMKAVLWVSHLVA